MNTVIGILVSGAHIAKIIIITVLRVKTVTTLNIGGRTVVIQIRPFVMAVTILGLRQSKCPRWMNNALDVSTA